MKWGIDPIPNGAQINFLDEAGRVAFHIPFQGECIRDFVAALIEHGLSEDQRRSLVPAITNGIHLPGRDFDPNSPPQG